MGYYNYGRKSAKDWLNDKKRVKGCSVLNKPYLQAYNQCKQEMGRCAILTYLLTARLGVKDCRQMLMSAKRQNRLIGAIRHDLKIYYLDEEWARVLKNDANAIHRRAQYVFEICKDNLRLTEYYPYFEHVGFDKLSDFTFAYRTLSDDEQEEMAKTLLAEIDEYKSTHANEIITHIEAVQSEIDARDAHREKIRAKDKAEKDAIKAERKRQKAEEKEIAERQRQDEIRKKKINKELNTTLKRVHGEGTEIF